MRIVWFVCGLLNIALRCNIRVWWCCKFFLSRNLWHLSKPQSLQLHNCHIISHRMSKHMAEFKKPARGDPKEKEMRRVGNIWTPVTTHEEASGDKRGMSNWQSNQYLCMWNEKNLDHTFEGDEDARCSQWVIDHWVPENEAGQCQEGVDRPQTVQLHVWPTSSSTQSVIFKRNLCKDKKRTHEYILSQLHTTI